MHTFIFVWTWPDSDEVSGEQIIKAESAERAAIKFLTGAAYSVRKIVAVWGTDNKSAEQARELNAFLHSEC